ncbi:MAG: hypothetical protein RLZZ127_3105, partial [Planctomycetota bacterium]
PTSESDPVPSLYEGQGRICDLLSTNADDTLIGMGAIVIDPATLAWVNYGVTRPTGTRGWDPRMSRPADDYLAGPATMGHKTPGVYRFLTSPAVGMVEKRSNNVASKGQDGVRFGTFGAYETQYRGYRIIRDGTTLFAFDRGLTAIEHTPDWTPIGPLLPRQDNKGKGTVLIERLPARMIEGGLLAGDTFYVADDRTVHVIARTGAVQGTLVLPAPIVMHGVAAAAGRLYVAQEDGVIRIYGGG